MAPTSVTHALKVMDGIRSRVVAILEYSLMVSQGAGQCPLASAKPLSYLVAVQAPLQLGGSGSDTANGHRQDGLHHEWQGP